MLSAHEHDVAEQAARNNDAHFWGELNLSRSPSIEFNMIRERGLPLRFEDVAAHLADCRPYATPIRYLVVSKAI